MTYNIRPEKPPPKNPQWFAKNMAELEQRWREDFWERQILHLQRPQSCSGDMKEVRGCYKGKDGRKGY